MTVISFDKNGDKVNHGGSTAGDYLDIGLCSIYKCRKKNLPAWADKNVFYYAQDTNTLYAGKGPNEGLEIVSSIKKVDELPAVGLEEKMYLFGGKLYYWDKDSNGYLISGQDSSGATPVIPTKIIEVDTVDELPIVGVGCALYIVKENSALYRFNVETNKYINFNKNDAFEQDIQSLKDTIVNKVDVSTLDNYRNKDDRILERELEQDLINKINGLHNYDDTVLISEISRLNNSKANKTDLDNCLKSDSVITESQLHEDVINKLNAVLAPYDDSDIRNSLENKADKSVLDNYLKNNTTIEENQLSLDVQNKLNAVPPEYDDSLIKADINNLSGNKADKSELTNYRPKSEKINESDLSDSVIDKLISVPDPYDDTDIKNELAEKALSTDLDTAKNRIAELEDLIQNKYIHQVYNCNAISVANDTSFDSITTLPESISVMLHTCEKANIPVTWNKGNYNGTIAGDYNIIGTLNCPEHILNKGSFTASIKISVAAPIVSGDGSFELRFQLYGAGVNSINISEIPGWDNNVYSISDDDFYGPNENGSNRKVFIYYQGGAAEQYKNENGGLGLLVPVSMEYEADGYVKDTRVPDWYVDYDSTDGTIQFSNGSLATRVYRIIKTA